MKVVVMMIMMVITLTCYHLYHHHHHHPQHNYLQSADKSNTPMIFPMHSSVQK